MTKSHIENEMSRCLDGRLTSEARAKLMVSIAESEELTSLWQEMKAGQELALGQPTLSVGRNFREDVWKRLQAGEGAPEFATHTPVSSATKVRYGILGAAAAAAFILATHFAFRDNGSEIPNEPRNVVGEPEVYDLDPNGMSAMAVAQRAANHVGSAVSNLRSYGSELDNKSVQELRDNQALALRVQGQIRMLENSVNALSELQQHDFLRIENSGARDCLVRAQATLQALSKGNWPEDYKRVMQSLVNCKLEDLQRNMTMPIQSGPMFPAWFEQLSQEHPDRFRRIVIGIFPNGHRVEIRELRRVPGRKPDDKR